MNNKTKNWREEMEEKLLYIIRRHYAFVMAECGKAFAHWEDRETPCEQEYLEEIKSLVSKQIKKAKQEGYKKALKDVWKQIPHTGTHEMYKWYERQVKFALEFLEPEPKMTSTVKVFCTKHSLFHGLKYKSCGPKPKSKTLKKGSE